MRQFLHVCLTVSALLGSSAAAPDQADLYQLIDARLALMEQVAQWKWQHQVAIEDLEREAVVLQATVESSLNEGIEPDAARRFFADQIEAAKEVQEYWWQGYEASPPPRTSVDLKQIRSRLLSLGNAIIKNIGQAGHHDQERFNAEVVVEGLSDETRDGLFRSLRSVRRFDSRLEQILQTRVLRVGTTGDYAPFSFAADGDKLAGADIDLARDLAESLGVEVRWISTSWPNLMDDLLLGRYDIAMSGVSRTLARQKLGYFSPPYHVGGKTPIVRCEDRKKFYSLDTIDRPGTRLIVNPGGTNHAFVTDHIRRADVILFDDNRDIFDEIIHGRADAMITDAIEVNLMSRRHESLCSAMPGMTLTYQEKAYLMPQDIPLKEYVSAWLELRIADGTVDTMLEQHLQAD